ncbi:CHAT domain-containing protein, partial [Streptomonospora algeriensis]
AVLQGPAARVDEVLRALEGAGIAHLAAHGSASAQTPMLASVRLEDGPLFAYDAERLSRAPRVTVLSSCWVGGSVPASSGAPLGMAASLLAMGGTVVVAGVLPVSDHGIGAAMLGFHRALRAGVAPARAVADHLADAGFICYGTG